MKESIREIISKLIVASAMIVFFILVMLFVIHIANKTEREGIGINNRQISINILDDKILCEDEIEFKIKKWEELEYRFGPEYTGYNMESISNIKMYVNGVIVDTLHGLSGQLKIPEHEILLIDKIRNKEKGKVNIKITYELDKEYIKPFKDVSVLQWNIDGSSVDYINNLTFNIVSNKNIRKLKAKGFRIKHDGQKYTLSKKYIYDDVVLNMLLNIDTDLNIISENSYLYVKGSKLFKNMDDKKGIMNIFLIISLITALIAFIINYKKRRVEGYRRETSNLISPMFAESIIDGKIGLKEFIMTTIIELHIRGNIKIIDNDMIELVSIDELEKYEENLIQLLFNGKEKILLSDINNMFLMSNTKTKKFKTRMSAIKSSVQELLFRVRIFSKKLTILNKIIRIISIVLLIDSIALLFPIKNFFNNTTLFTYIFIPIIIFLAITQINRKPWEKNSFVYREDEGISHLLVLLIFFIIIALPIITVGMVIYNALYFINLMFVIAINIWTINMCNRYVLTKYGKEERIELLRLKKYMKDYSLIEERDLQSTIIWDEYMAYATAFGMPSDVVKSIYEKWYNLNLILQFIADF